MHTCIVPFTTDQWCQWKQLAKNGLLDGLLTGWTDIIADLESNLALTFVLVWFH